MKKLFKKFVHSHPYRHVLIVSYIFLVLICIFVNLIGQTYTLRSSLSEYTDANENIILQTVNLFENDFAMMESTAYLLANSTYASYISTSSNYQITADSRYVRGLIYDIKLFNQTSPYFESCYVLFKEQNICLNRDGKYDMQTAYNLFFSDYYDSKETFVDDIFTPSSKKVWKAIPKHNETWLVAYSSKKIFVSDIAVIIKLNRSSLNKNLTGSTSANNCTFSIFNNDNILIYSNNDALKAGISLDSMMNDDSFSYGDDSYVVKSFSNDTNTRKYLYIVPKSIMRKNTDFHVFFIIVFCLISLISCIIFSNIMSKLSYSPIEELMRRLGQSSDSKTSEFAYIYEKLNELKHSASKQNRILNKKVKKTRDDILRKILSGDIETHEKNTEFYIKNNLPFTGKAYVVIAFSMINPGVLVSKNTSEDTDLAYVAVSSVFSDLTSDIFVTTYVEMSDTLICLITLDDENFPYKSFLNSKITQTAEFLEDNMGIKFSCGISQMLPDVSDIPILYDQSIELITLNENTLENKCVFYADIYEESMYEFTSAQQLNLYNIISACNSEAAQKFIFEIFSHNIEEHKINIDKQRNLFFELLSTIIRASSDNFEHNSSEVIDIPKFRLANANQISESIKRLSDFAVLLCETNKKHKNTNPDKCSTSDKVESIKSYIRENYDNMSLNVNMIASHFNLSSSHISRMFKEYEKCGIANYIVNCRIKKAIVLLKKTNKNIADIATESGFTNVNIFIRTFKKVVGVTPGQYRQS